MLQKLLQGIVPALGLWFGVAAWAQDTAVLSGTITDPTGAVVAGAQVNAVNVATNFDAATETNSEGIYRLPFLRPGTYRERITAPSINSFVLENVELRDDAKYPSNTAL